MAIITLTGNSNSKFLQKEGDTLNCWLYILMITLIHFLVDMNQWRLIKLKAPHTSSTCSCFHWQRFIFKMFFCDFYCANNTVKLIFYFMILHNYGYTCIKTRNRSIIVTFDYLYHSFFLKFKFINWLAVASPPYKFIKLRSLHKIFRESCIEQKYF